MARRSKRTDEYERSSSNPFPLVTEDGTTWRDAVTHEPAATDADGRLAKPFVLELISGAHETWAVGMKLPLTPATWDKVAADLVAKRPPKKRSTEKED